MAATYRLSLWRRAANVLIRALLRAGLAPPHTYLLTVRGRRSGRLYSTPVTLVEESGQRWIVAPYGEVNWVRNARSAGTVKLSRGRKSEVVKILELPPQPAAPVLKKYVERVPITRPFFDVSPDSSLDEFIAEAPRHPVFRARSGGGAEK
jgi:deazaflavin-dependent oxidoreductase (nitroreductase family)